MARKRKTGGKKKRGYNVWSSDEIKALRQHSKDRTPVKKVAKEMKRTEATIRMKAYKLGFSLGHRRRAAKKTRRKAR